MPIIQTKKYTLYILISHTDSLRYYCDAYIMFKKTGTLPRIAFTYQCVTVSLRL